MRLIIRILINMFGLWLADRLVPGITLGSDDLLALLLLAVVFGLVNAFIRPIVRIFSLPITVLTLGLFTFVINAFMLMLTSWITQNVLRQDLLIIEGSFTEKFVAALLGSLVISAVSVVAGWLLPD